MKHLDFTRHSGFRLLAIGAAALLAQGLLVNTSWAQGSSSASSGRPSSPAAGRPTSGIRTPGAMTPAAQRQIENFGKVPPPAAEPKYLELPTNTDRREYVELKSKVDAVLRGDSLDPVSADFNRFFLEFILPEFTKVANIDSLANSRRNLKRQYLLSAKNPEGHRRINDLVIQRMAGVTVGNFHPFVRYNAMLMIADLNSREPTRTEAAVPYPPALETLLKALNFSGLPDGPRVAALYGVLRHAQAGIPDAQKPAVQKMAQTLAGQAKSPEHRDEAAHMWLRMRGADILLAMGQNAPQLQLPPPPAIEFAGDYPERVLTMTPGAYGYGSEGGYMPSSSGSSRPSRMPVSRGGP